MTIEEVTYDSPTAVGTSQGKRSDWDVEIIEDAGKSWAEMSGWEKSSTVAVGLMKLCIVCALLYLFIVSLSIMGSAFKVIAGPTAGQVFRNSEIFDNPIAGLVLGVLATVLVQSSSTSTSVIITMAASDLLEVKDAIFMVMGANVGTSVTNTIVSIFQIGDRDQYRRAFAGATVHDCFNVLTVIVLLPVEAATGMLKAMSESVVGGRDFEQGEKHDFLKKITKPLTSRIVEVDKKLVEAVAQAESGPDLDELLKKSMFKNSINTGNNLFLDTPLSDSIGGLIMLVVSLVILSTCLILLVKLLQSMFKGRMAHAMKWLLNLEFEAVPQMADYILIVFGMIMTILMQSSSVTTSTLTPLVGIGMVRLEKMFCFTVGANIGTTCTGVLSALASSKIETGMKVALAHVFFNLIGTALWFPIPFIRAVPLNMAKALGCIAADWKWFPMAYIAVMFGLLPGLLLLLSLIHWAALLAFLLVFLPAVTAAVTILALRMKSPQRIPAWMLKDPVVAGRSVLPPSLMMHPPDERHFEGVGQGSGKDGMTQWRMEPCVWGPKWFVICMLLISVLNAKWADIKYAPWHDNRHHFGIGAYKTCSKAFESDARWAAQPVDGAACQAHFASCATAFENCTVAPNFADEEGQDQSYWKLMIKCTDRCAISDWEAACISLGCTGSKHQQQCRNVSEASSRNSDADVAYVTSFDSVPWTAGRSCREPGLLCDNDEAIAHCGNLALAGMLVVFVAQLQLFIRGLFGKELDKMMLIIVCTLDALAWLLLLASWTHFLSTRGSHASCIVAVPGDHGYVMAHSAFNNIINAGGSYTFYITIVCWLCMSAIIAAMLTRIATYNRSQRKAEQ